MKKLKGNYKKKAAAFVLSVLLTAEVCVPDIAVYAAQAEEPAAAESIETTVQAEEAQTEEPFETESIIESETEETDETVGPAAITATETAEETAAETDDTQTAVDMSRVTWDDVPSMGWDDPEGNTEVRKSAETFDTESGIAMFSSRNEKKIKAYGVDISQHNGDIDWKKVKAAGVDFAIIRVGGRGYGSAGNIYKDDDAQKNIEGALAAGVKVGVYFFSTALNEQEAIEEAKYTCSVIRNYDITYPVVYDHEGYDQKEYRNYGLSREVRTKSAIAFMNYVEAQGYEPMMYSSSAHFRDDSEWTTSALEQEYGIWVAQYWEYKDSNGNWKQYSDYEMAKNNPSSYEGRYTIWQFTSEGKIDGINSSGLDMDIEYYDDGSDQKSLNIPQLTEAANTKEGNIHLTWKEVEGADAYRVYRKEPGKSWSRIGDTNGVAAVSFIDTEVTGGTDYTYTVRAYDSAAMSGYQSGLSVRCLEPAAVTSAAVVSGGIHTAWKSVKGAQGYYIYRRTGQQSYQRIGHVSGNQTTEYVDTEAVSGENNIYTVLAYYGSSKSNYNSEASSYYLKAPAIESLSLQGDTAALQWSQIAGAKGYCVYRKEKGKNWSRIATMTDADACSFSDSAVKSGNAYTYTVRSYNDNAMSTYDSQKEIMFLTQPQLVGTAASGGGIQVKWKKCSNVDGYIIYRKESNTAWQRIAKTAGGSLESYTDDNAESGKVYTYTVRSYKANDMSDFSRSGISGKYTERLLNYRTTADVYYRTGPGTSYSIAGILASGKNIELVSGYSKKVNGYTWYKMKMGGKYYYIVSNYVQRV